MDTKINTNIDDLKKSFKDKSLIKLAFIHRSWLNEIKGENQSNERLEFLGDAVLELVVSAWLYQEFPAQKEGYLTSLRANLVNTENLSAVARQMHLGEALFLSKGEEEGGGRDNSSILANTLEALIGALYLDQGIIGAENFIKKNILSGVNEKLSQPLKDAKSRLQEALQAQGKGIPKYSVAKEVGPDHAKEFEVLVRVGRENLASGVGKSKSEAEQKAASAGLVKLGLKS